MEKSSTAIYKVAIVGPESTGKSWLAQSLANHYHEPWVTEQARAYLAQIDRNYNLNDIVKIAALQLEAEMQLLPECRKFLFCDTSLLVNKVWSNFVYNTIPPEINEWYNPEHYQLHLLCNIDLPWEYDPLREHPHKRQELFDIYENELIKDKCNYHIVSGLGQERLNNAIEIIDKNRF